MKNKAIIISLLLLISLLGLLIWKTASTKDRPLVEEARKSDHPENTREVHLRQGRHTGVRPKEDTQSVNAAQNEVANLIMSREPNIEELEDGEWERFAATAYAHGKAYGFLSEHDKDKANILVLGPKVRVRFPLPIVYPPIPGHDWKCQIEIDRKTGKILGL